MSTARSQRRSMGNQGHAGFRIQTANPITSGSGQPTPGTRSVPSDRVRSEYFLSEGSSRPPAHRHAPPHHGDARRHILRAHGNGRIHRHNHNAHTRTHRGHAFRTVQRLRPLAQPIWPSKTLSQSQTASQKFRFQTYSNTPLSAAVGRTRS